MSFWAIVVMVVGGYGGGSNGDYGGCGYGGGGIGSGDSIGCDAMERTIVIVMVAVAVAVVESLEMVAVLGGGAGVVLGGGGAHDGGGARAVPLAPTTGHICRPSPASTGAAVSCPSYWRAPWRPTVVTGHGSVVAPTRWPAELDRVDEDGRGREHERKPPALS